jgi:hypothetical protein
MKTNRQSAIRICLFLLIAASLSAQDSNANRMPDAQIVLDLQARAKTYLDLRKKVAGDAPKAADSPTAISTAQRQLADKVRVARAGAKQGEFFSPQIARYLRKQIAATMAGPKGSSIRASLRHAEPVTIHLEINQSYPDDVPLQSTPPTLLQNLPELPKGLEYRLLDNELVLRDSDANVVVDYILNALPG